MGTKIVIANPSNTIKQIQFTKEDLAYYDNPQLFAQLNSFFSGKNIILANQQTKKYTKQIQQHFPIVQKIDIKKIGANKALIDIIFEQPKIIFLLSWQMRGTLNETFFPIPLTSTLATDRTTLQVHLPTYYQKDFPLSGFFFQIGEQQLAQQITTLRNNFPKAQIVYLPGGSKYIVKLWDKTIFFDGTKSIEGQVKTFKLLQSNQNKLSKEVRQWTKADVGSISWSVILWK